MRVNPWRWMMLAVPSALLLVGIALADDAATAVESATPVKPATPEEIAFFEARVRPLLVKHCYECHSESAKSLKGGLKVDGAEALLKGGDSGTALVPHKPEESPLIEAVRYASADLQMPPAGKLKDEEVADLVKWVEQGATFPKTETVATNRRKAMTIEEGKQFWAIRPFTHSEPSPLQQPNWPQRRIDGYILSALEAKNLKPSAQAERRTLIRRAYFDLVGLPPSPEEVEAFVADASADAYPKLIEQLLASPHYGERWGRYWLDLARYCDVPEQWAQTPAQAWLYRDWVVAALNEDLPYDQFVIRQLAADQLDEFRPRDVAALGFIGLSPSYWKELKLAPDVIKVVVAEEWEEHVNAVSSTLLGMTTACARCHDHKFDPITQQDYYGLAGIFASIRMVPLPMLAPAEAHAVAEAHVQYKLQEAEAEKFTTMIKREPTKEAEYKQKATEALARAATIKQQTPHFSDPLAYAVEDAALQVMPDGPDRTKLEFQVGQGQDVALQIRGNPAKPGPVVARRFLSVLSSGEPAKFSKGSGRREFAEAVFRDAAPLSARVMVNRVWKHHFGQALVDTPSNFGTQGSRPTNPELLDDLAERFIAAGWSLKWLHRELMLSATYQQTSAVSDALQAVDPENRLFGRMSRRRLEVEPWRDSMLSGSGTLDATLGGAPMELGDVAHVRRTLYGTVRRRELHDLLRLYDFPDPTGHSPARLDTTTPLQQLFVLNSDFLGRQALALANRVRREQPTDSSAQIRRAYALLYSRPPTEKELSLATAFLGPTPNDATWQQYAEVLLASNELMFVD